MYEVVRSYVPVSIFLRHKTIQRSVHTCGKHALYEVLGVTENYPISFCPIALRGYGLNLNTLAYRDREIPSASIGIIENRTRQCQYPVKNVGFNTQVVKHTLELRV